MTNPRSTPFGDRYQPVALLGRGGMADVYRAHDPVLHRDVAVKVLRDVTGIDRGRFAGEAHALARLAHPSIVRLLDAGVDDDEPWLALELVEGSTLADLLRDGPLAPDTVARVGAAVAAGLAEAHAQGVVHRDVKPANVLVGSDGRVRLGDFGIARLTDATSGLTVTGNTVGTAAYISPEQVRGETVTGAADVYSWGLVLLESLTGRREYQGAPVEAAVARLHRNPHVPTSLPAGWSRVIAAMTATDPAERPEADQVRQWLDGLAGRSASSAGDTAVLALSDLPVAASAADASPVGVAAPPEHQRRRAVPIVVGAVATVALVLGLAVAIGSGDGGTGADPVGESPSTTPAQSATTPTTVRSATPSSSASATVPTTPATPAQTKRAAPAKPKAGNDKVPKAGKGKKPKTKAGKGNGKKKGRKR